jgi:hypothetical protein
MKMMEVDSFQREQTDPIDLQLEVDSVLVVASTKLLYGPLSTDPLHDDTLPDNVGKTVGNHEAPELPSKPFGQNVVHDSRVIRFNVPCRHGITEFVM